MIVASLNTKGGVGKSSLMLSLALKLAMEGRDPWLVDGDRQGTAIAAIAQRGNRTPGLAVSHYTEGQVLRQQVLQQRHKFTDICIDAGGRDSTALRAALMLADVVIVPFQPRSFDVWGLQDMHTLVQEALAVRDGLLVCAVLNCADPTGRDNADAAEAVKDFPAFTYLDAPIGRRKAIADAAGNGLSVWEHKPSDGKAIVEMQRLYDAIFNTKGE